MEKDNYINHLIFNSFYINDLYSTEHIYNYINCRIPISKKYVKKLLQKKINNDKLIVYNKKTDCETYILTKKGKITRDSQMKLNINIIERFWKKYKYKNKTYDLVERRTDQCLLRKYLIDNHEHRCKFCKKEYPLCILEAAHIKPFSDSNQYEKYDTNNVLFLCSICHKLYDNGLITINSKHIQMSSSLNHDHLKNLYMHKVDISNNNIKYFNYHNINIYKS